MGSHTHRRQRDQERELSEIANQFGVVLDKIEPTRNGHVRAVFRSGKKAAALIMAKGYSGDWRAELNNTSRVRRHLRALVNQGALTT